MRGHLHLLLKLKTTLTETMQYVVIALRRVDTMAISPFVMVVMPSSHPANILLFPRVSLRGVPFPVQAMA